MLEVSTPKDIDLEGSLQKRASAEKQGIDEMKNMQKRNASSMHAQNMQNLQEQHKHSLAYMVERAKKERQLNKEIYEDKFRAKQVELQTSAESTQRSADTSFATSIFGVKSGEERMKAVAKYQTETQYNTQKAALEQKHAAQTEQQEKQGATEEQKAKLKQLQTREMGELDQAKSFKDAIVDAMGQVGTLRDMTKEQGVGTKSSLADAHERIRASAFGHIKDPAADAVTKMAREQQFQHARLMDFLALNTPHILSALQSQGNAMTMSTINNFNSGLGAGPL